MIKAHIENASMTYFDAMISSDIERYYEIIKLAEMMHNKYEDFAREEGWVTQESTRVPFALLPLSNKMTMLRLAEELLIQFGVLKVGVDGE